MSIAEQILKQAELLTGKLEGSSRERLLVLCTAVMYSLASQLTVEPEEIQELFVPAASLMAYASWSRGEGISEFRAGDLTVKKSQTSAQEEQALALVRPYLKSGFFFLGV